MRGWVYHEPTVIIYHEIITSAYDPAIANRHLRGEELQRLNIEELQQLEKSLESGLACIMEKKVWLEMFTLLWYRSRFYKIFPLVSFYLV